MLTDCLEQCQANDTCRAVNYETGLCVLFSSDADQLPGMFIKMQQCSTRNGRNHISFIKYRYL